MKVFENLEQLQQDAVMRIFTAITAWPRPSGGEEIFGNWIIAYASKRKWRSQRDSMGNILVIVPATSGYESLAPVCLQAHQDMVCIDEYDMTYSDERFPLALRLEGDWLMATGTTLGADNGVGIALALALASETEHGMLELLFTVQEETGLHGAGSITLPITAKRLINLDSEDWRELTIGCAGGARADLTCPVTYTPVPPGASTWMLSIEGLPGGHSGIEIGKGHANAIHIGAEILSKVNGDFQDIRLVQFTGGVRSNAIPAKADVKFTSSQSAEALARLVDTCALELRQKYQAANPNLKVTLQKDLLMGFAVDSATSTRVLQLITALPHGVISMSPVGGIPQTSINLALVSLDVETKALAVQFMARSSKAADMKVLQLQLQQQCRRFTGASAVDLPLTLTFSEGYPGWEPQPNGAFVRAVTKLWATFSREPLKVTAVHAGLECGLLKGKYPDVDMVSLGPDIRGAHSANERVSLSSVDECFRFLQLLLVKLDEGAE